MRSLLCSFTKIKLFNGNISYYRSQNVLSTLANITHKSTVRERENNLNEIVKAKLQCGVNFTDDQWKLFTQKLINKEIVVPGSYINTKNVSGVILRLCADFRLFDVGKAYFDHLKAKKEPMNDGILSRYLRLCTTNKTYALNNEDEILSIYKHLRKSEIIEPLIGERCISAVCLYEKHWKDAFYLFEEIKTNANPSPSSYFSIAEACFRFGDPERGWQILRSFAVKSTARPSPECYAAYIDHCQRLRDSKSFTVKDIEELFIYLEEFNFNLPSTELVEKLDKFIFSLSDDQFDWSLKETYIPKSAVCSSCRRLLEPVVLSSTEFQDLRETFAKKAMVGKNVFLKSTPQEMENFKMFLKKAGTFDIVIDGLNMAFARGRKDPLTLAVTLKSVVAHFVRKNMKIVVLGRQHMKYWPIEHMKYIYDNAQVFLAMNLSQDDPLLLYAALKGGEHTKIISRDLMRSHLFALEDTRVKLLFRKWLVSHQYMLGFFNKIGRPSILPPLPYRPTAQKMLTQGTEVCWHVPYDLEYLMMPSDNREPPARWLCIRRVPKRTSR